MKVLVTGANGFLGKKIVKILKQKNFTIIPTSKIKDSTNLFLDITKKESVLELLKSENPDVVIHTAALTNVDWCEENPKETFKVNVEGTKNVCNGCIKTNAKMVLISTDYIFDGSKSSSYVENDKPNPLGVYANSKLEAELVVLDLLQDFLIGRVTALYGFNDQLDKTTFPKFVLTALTSKHEIKCFTDQYSNPTLIDDVANALVKLIEKNKKGIYHMTGSENLNRFEFAKKIAKIFELNGDLIKTGTWIGSGHKSKRPKMIKSSIEKLQGEGIKMNNINEGLLIMKKQMELQNL